MHVLQVKSSLMQAAPVTSVGYTRNLLGLARAGSCVIVGQFLAPPQMGSTQVFFSMCFMACYDHIEVKIVC